MMVNAAYAGFVTGRRVKSTSIKGLHPPLIDWELFERVQALRTTKTTTQHPGRPGAGYALSKLLLCERCGARMHGNAGGRQGARRYVCSTRKQDGSCTEPIIAAEPIEENIASYVRAFDPPHAVKLAVVRRLKAAGHTGDKAAERAQRQRLVSQLERTKDLYLLGDLSREQYIFKSQVLRDEMRRLDPPPTIDASEEAAAALTNFGLFWERETDGHERNRLLRLIFEKITVKDGRLASVTPRDAFLPFFEVGKTGREIRERRDSNPRPPA
jgi:hypothetical protein